MRKVLIVDDELLVRVGLKSTIRWEENGYNLIGDARNGKEAIELFEKYGADIIITDISMPVIDGIELIKILKSKKESLKFIILSHHDDFKFAQEAIELGVVKYILKHELTESSLLSVLEKLNDNEEKGLTYSHNDNEKKELNYNDDLYYWLKDDYKTEQLEFEILSQNQYSLLKEYFFIMSILINFNYDYTMNIDEQNIHYQKIIDNVVREMSNEENISLFLVTKGKEMIYMVKANKMSLQQEKIRDFMLTVKRNVKRIIDLKLTIGISDLGKSYQTMHETYKQAKYAQENSFFENNEIFIYKDVKLSSYDNSYSFDENYLRELVNKGTSEVEVYMDSIFKQLYEMKNMDTVGDVARKMGNLAALMINEINKQNDKIKIDEVKQIERFFSFFELKDYFMALFTNIADIIHKSHNNGSHSFYVRKVIHYFEENYHKNLSLAEVADYLQINKSYLSVLFKQVTGVNFSVYLIRVRIEKAKELLIETDKKIYEIAEEVGFESPYYFSTVFKKFTQLSCKEYRDKYYIL